MRLGARPCELAKQMSESQDDPLLGLLTDIAEGVATISARLEAPGGEEIETLLRARALIKENAANAQRLRHAVQM